MTQSEEIIDSASEPAESTQAIDVAQLLNQKRVALNAARERYKQAKLYRDEEAMATEMRLIDALRALVSELEAQDTTSREAKGIAAAKARLVGIKRAFGSVQSNIDADEQRVNEKIAELTDAIARLNDRYSQTVQLRAEAMALSDRFSLPKPKLPDVVAPARREIAMTLTRLPNRLGHAVVPYLPTEECEHHMRTRRTYAEATGTEGYAIIESAGLKSYPELTERQHQIIAARVREKEQERRAMAGLPKLAAEGRFSLGSI